VLLRELATETGLAGTVAEVLLDTYRGLPVHVPGQVFADLAVAIADGADAVTGIEVLRDRESLFGPVASMPTAWRLLDRTDEVHLGRVRVARAAARDRAWAADGDLADRPGVAGRQGSHTLQGDKAPPTIRAGHRGPGPAVPVLNQRLSACGDTNRPGGAGRNSSHSRQLTRPERACSPRRPRPGGGCRHRL
jgi:hypothetical protein